MNNNVRDEDNDWTPESLEKLKDFLSMFAPEDTVLVVGEGKSTAGEQLEAIDEELKRRKEQ